MTSYTLKDDGYPFKKIMEGKKWIGRVLPHAEGGYLGIIAGRESVRMQTERQAFEEIVARRMGYSCAADLHAKNAQVRRENAARRDRAQYAAQRYLSAKTMDERFAAIDVILGIKP